MKHRNKLLLHLYKWSPDPEFPRDYVRVGVFDVRLPWPGRTYYLYLAEVAVDDKLVVDTGLKTMLVGNHNAALRFAFAQYENLVNDHPNKESLKGD